MICIITVYKSFNYGSFLQAKALYDIFKNYDSNVKLLDGKFRPWINKSQIQSIFSCLIRVHLYKVWYIISKIIQNYKQWQTLPSIPLSEAKKIKNIIYVIGSDEIWNVSRKECQNPYFWGQGLSGVFISFSPSINTATIEELKRFDYVRDGLDTIAYISVRDDYSKTILSALTDKNITITLDPTLMFGYEYYGSASQKKLGYKYIALYLFANDLEQRDIDNIIRFAKDKQLKLVSLAQDLNWCDINVRVSNGVPFLYYQHAEYIVTNTFHGTAFAINFNKDFISLSSNGKVFQLLEQFSLTQRIARGLNYIDFKKKAESRIDFKILNEKKEKFRQISLEYIEHAMKLVTL